MAIAISDAHRELGAVARSFLENNKARAASRALLDAPDEALPPFWDELAQLGWLGLHVPEEFGGSGYGVSELVVVLEELGRAAAPGPFLGTRHGVDAHRPRGRRRPARATSSRRSSTGRRRARSGSAARCNSMPTATSSGDAGLVLGAGLADVLVLRAGDDMVIVESSRRRGRDVGATGSRPDPPRRPGHGRRAPRWTRARCCAARSRSRSRWRGRSPPPRPSGARRSASRPRARTPRTVCSSGGRSRCSRR